jgi:hypothetical protein
LSHSAPCIRKKARTATGFFLSTSPLLQSLSSPQSGRRIPAKGETLVKAKSQNHPTRPQPRVLKEHRIRRAGVADVIGSPNHAPHHSLKKPSPFIHFRAICHELNHDFFCDLFTRP